MFTFSKDFESALGQIIQTKLREEVSKLISEHKLNASERHAVQYLTKSQVCNRLNISLSALNNYLKKGIIPRHTIGGRVLIKEIDIQQL